MATQSEQTIKKETHGFLTQLTQPAMPVSPYPTWVEVNLAAVENNVKNSIRQAGVPLMAVIKANAYGHGSVEISKAALEAGASAIAVARFCEALTLRQSGIDAPILVLGMVTPEEVDQAIFHRITLTMHSYEVAKLFAERARAIGWPISVHLKVDTGLGRLGVPADEALALARFALEQGYIYIAGMYSHFANADIANDPLVPTQISRFQQALTSLHAAAIFPQWIHLSNTAGALVYPQASFTMVRAGQALIGLWPFDYSLPYPDYLTPALTWKARLASCKKMPAGWGIGYGQKYILPKDEWIGVIPVGYGDGLRRTGNNEVIIDGQKVPVRGNVCMDQTMIHLPRKYALGEEVVIIGRQGKESIQIVDLALRWKTVQVDVAAGIHIRVPRVYGRE
jgi:alanine racemase